MALSTYISLFSGGAGLDLAVRLAMPDARCVCYVEREIGAASILAARMEDGSLEPAPLWSDVRTFPWRLYRGRVAGIVGGFPCQDLSVAGKRAGISGKRSGLFEEIITGLIETGASWAFIENVGGLVSSLTLLHKQEIVEHLDALFDAAESAETPKQRWYIERHRERLHRRLLRIHGIPALLYVQCRLEEVGYRSKAGFFTASEAGGSHKRERVFILAYRPELGWREGWSESARLEGRHDVAECSGSVEITSGRASREGRITTPREEARCRSHAGPSGSGGILDDSELPERWAFCSCGRSRGEGADGERQASGGAGITDPMVGHTHDPRPQRRSLCRCGCGDERAAGAPGVACVADSEREPYGPKHEHDSGERSAGPADHGSMPGIGSLDLPLFPPGPGDADAWQRILAEHPHLAPAIEPGLRVLADGMAMVVDEARTDQLRAGGNGVVAIQGALALRELMRRTGLIHLLSPNTGATA